MATEPTQTWWLAINGQPQGPFSTERLILDLQSGQISGTSLVCPTHGGQWAAAATFPELAASTPPRRALPGGAASEWLLLVAGWYELVAVPCLKVLAWVISSQLPEVADPLSAPARLKATVEFVGEAALFVLMIGGCAAGLKLLQRRRDGVAWMTAVVSGQWITAVTTLGVLALLNANAPPGTLEDASDPDTFVSSALFLVIAVLLFGCLFEVVSLVWLWCIRPFLPPSSHS